MCCLCLTPASVSGGTRGQICCCWSGVLGGSQKSVDVCAWRPGGAAAMYLIISSRLEHFIHILVSSLRLDLFYSFTGGSNGTGAAVDSGQLFSCLSEGRFGVACACPSHNCPQTVGFDPLPSSLKTHHSYNEIWRHFRVLIKETFWVYSSRNSLLIIRFDTNGLLWWCCGGGCGGAVVAVKVLCLAVFVCRFACILLLQFS